MSELCNIKSTKLKKATIEKFIEISKVKKRAKNNNHHIIINMNRFVSS